MHNAMYTNDLWINVDDADCEIRDIGGRCRTEDCYLVYHGFNVSPHTSRRGKVETSRNAGSVANGKGEGDVKEGDVPIMVG